MRSGKSEKLFAALVIALVVLAFGHMDIRPAQTCDSGMVFAPGGTFYAGLGEEEFNYVLHLCTITIGNCYDSWFENELPRRAVKYKSFCMDKYEYPNQPGEYPMTGVSFEHAKTLCKRQGKRLCTRVEWEHVCQAGALDNIWAYGYTYSQGVCNDYSTGLLPSGYKRNCVSATGVFDMTGNVAEWVEGEVTSATGGMLDTYNILKGGSYRQRPIFSRCTAIDYRSPERAHADFGFRCCDDTLLQKSRRAEPPR